MPVAYAMADHGPSADGRVAAGHIRLPTDRGGCGNEHEIETSDRGYAFIDCPRCAPALVGSHYGWAATPGGVPLTPDELGDRELAERDAKSSQNTLLRAMTDSFVKAVQTGPGFQFPSEDSPAGKAPSLLDQIKAMSAEEKAALASVLAPAGEIPAKTSDANDDEPPKHKDAEPPAKHTDTAPVKRGPGRPRTIR
jgi:hypothetical protein